LKWVPAFFWDRERHTVVQTFVEYKADEPVAVAVQISIVLHFYRKQWPQFFF